MTHLKQKKTKQPKLRKFKLKHKDDKVNDSRLKQKTKKRELGAETLTKIPFINTDILLDTKE